MSGLRALIAIAAAATATTAFAGGSHLTDAQYLAAAHCQGLYDSHNLGPVDASGIDAVMRTEGRDRVGDVLDRADQARDQALREASHAGPGMRAALVSERDGACAAWTRPLTASASR